jgi:hypothetical protein
MSDDSKLWSEADAHYEVMLPCRPEEFRDFIAGLLGKPQTITRAFRGVFEVTQEDIQGFYHLVKQRIDQQNDATILQFTVRVVFDDDSSVLLNSYEDFVHYHEVRPIASVAAHLSWTLLIRFRDKPAPEKQTIDVSIVCYGVRRLPIFDGEEIGPIHRLRELGSAYISVHIHHTARTWGADIESLLSNHIKTLLKTRSKAKTFLAKYNGQIGVLTGLLFLLAALGGGIDATMKFSAAQLAALPLPGATVDARISYLLHEVATGSWARFAIYFAIYLSISLILSVTFMIWITESELWAEPSFLLLSKQAEKLKVALQRRYRRQWISIIAGFASAVVASLMANVLFVKLFGQ